ncbi:MAG TPA: protein kinase [Anaerolineales bacterium]|nr:protein kinase [Anaerolineales bacterium]
MSTWSGKTLGKVLIGDLIARGGMAEVYYGMHTTLNRKVAVKIMRDHVEDDPETRARFEREAQVVASLHHPNIIQVFDYDLVDGRPCLIMELVPGTSLSNYLKAIQKRGEKLPFNTMSHLLTAIAGAIDYAHDQNIVHRDIKPANILLRSRNGSIDLDAPLSEDVEPILTDFGLVRLLDSSIQTSTGTVSGTPTYMSPEQARGERVDKKTDIYSLGVLLYEMIAGNVPFDAESSFGVLMKHLNDPPPPIPGISSDLQSVIDRALAKDPKQRFSTASELTKEFISVFNGQTLSVGTETFKKSNTQTKAPEAKPVQSPRFLVLITGILSVLVIVFGGLFLFRQTPPATQPPAQASPSPTVIDGETNPLLVDFNKHLGRLTFLDFNNLMDQTLVNVNSLPEPEKGKHYEVWLLAEGGESRRNLGTIPMTGESGQLTFTSSEGKNILALFDQVEITVEPDNDPEPEVPSEEIIASSVFPPQALVHVRHVLVSFIPAPDGIALIQGFWSTADEIDTTAFELGEAFKNEDEATMRAKNEELINQIVGSGNADLFKDWNENGNIEYKGSAYGLLSNGDPGYDDEQGFLSQSISHAQFAARASDATENIITNSDSMIVCAKNVEGWAKQLLELAIQLHETPFGPEMEPIITEMQNLSYQMLYGVDTNGNQLIEPIVGEGGADTAYLFAYNMADMPLLPGPHRIPPPPSTIPTP